jgi:hypothetical protein
MSEWVVSGPIFDVETSRVLTRKGKVQEKEKKDKELKKSKNNFGRFISDSEISCLLFTEPTLHHEFMNSA